MFFGRCSLFFDFNPRSRKGSDVNSGNLLHVFIVFQSTLPQRERQNLYCKWKLFSINFNPRSRKGSDKPQLAAHRLRYISIHAPAKGATFTKRTLKRLLIFQSTLPQRERLSCEVSKERLFDISIHAPAKGATPYFSSDTVSVEISIHAPAKGATDTGKPSW